MKKLVCSLTELIDDLVKVGYLDAVSDIGDILQDLTNKKDEEKDENEEDEGKKENKETNVAANIVGLQEDGTISNMNQGFALAPAFSPYGSPDMP